ncbi:MAG: DUF4437 domain-containing protein [Polyangiaceae bacterium]
MKTWSAVVRAWGSGTACAMVVGMVGLVGCESDESSTPAAPADCFEATDKTLAGETKAFGDFEFKNAFDPTDGKVYDPSDAASLPGPLMVDAWGDRGTGAHGTLGVFPPGFAAPLHTHSAEYHGVVLQGQMTNPFGTDLDVFLDGDSSNDKGAVVLGPGSYWRVPAGSQHTTTCVGPEVCWFYFHSEEAFDFAPIVDASGQLNAGTTLESPPADAVLLPNAELAFQESAPFVSFAPAWGDMQQSAHGTFGKFIPGGTSPLHVHGASYYGVVISGALTNPFNSEPNPTQLTTGGYWSVPEKAVHVTACANGSECLFYFHQRAGFDFQSVCE